MRPVDGLPAAALLVFPLRSLEHPRHCRMAGTDRSRTNITGGPVVVLVSPQLMENVGSAARAMANFGLSELRIVAPREAFPSETATMFAAGAAYVLEGAKLFDTVEEAVADLAYVVATTARERGQAKPVDGPEEGARRLRVVMGEGVRAGILFGRERTGLLNEEIALADRILTFPVNPAYASLNLAQAVLLTGYAWAQAGEASLPFSQPLKSPPADKGQLIAFFAHLEAELDEVGFFRSPEKRRTMSINLRNIFQRLGATKQDLNTLHGVVEALVEGRRVEGVRRERRVLPALTDPEGMAEALPEVPLATIYMPLLEEGTDVWCPVRAVARDDGSFVVLGPRPEDEVWAFDPGARVYCQTKVFQGGNEGLVPFVRIG
jgi:tRNA/rRNA methyltransferase